MKKNNPKNTARITKAETPWYKNLLSFVFSIGLLAIFSAICFYGFWKWLLVLIPVIIILKGIFFSSIKSKFLKIQALLPTSTINAISMGMVEVIGDLKQIEPIISPYFSTPCIGYFYRIEEESPPDDDGHTSYHTIHYEQKIGIFNIMDETGIAKVDGTDLMFYNENVQKSQGGKTRHSEGYLLENDYMLLIGYASSENGNTVIKKGSEKEVFVIASPLEIENYNKNIPLFRSFLVTFFIITLLILFILLN